MLIVKLKKGDNINKALKRFKQKVRSTKLIRTIRENQYFEKPSQSRRKQKIKFAASICFNSIFMAKYCYIWIYSIFFIGSKFNFG